MADIFISYASSDRDRARLLAGALEQHGWSVWWDRVIPPGRAFDEVIEEALNAARCVVVLWSHASVKSDWVKTEAAEAAQKRILIPALIEDAQVPLQFRRSQAADLTAWTGAEEDAEFAKLCASIAPLVRSPTPPGPSGRGHAPGRTTFRSRWLVGVAILLLAAAILAWKLYADVAVPSVLGQGIDQARNTIAASGLITGDVTEEPADKAAPGTVMRQTPAPGSTLKKGAPVALVLAAAPKRAESSPPQGQAVTGDLRAQMFTPRVGFKVIELGIDVVFVGEESSPQGLSGVKGPGGFVMAVDSGPALKVGMRAGDVITAIAGAPIRSEDDLRQAFKKMGPGVTRFTIRRVTGEVTLDVDCPAACK